MECCGVLDWAVAVAPGRSAALSEPAIPAEMKPRREIGGTGEGKERFMNGGAE